MPCIASSTLPACSQSSSSPLKHSRLKSAVDFLDVLAVDAGCEGPLLPAFADGLERYVAHVLARAG